MSTTLKRYNLTEVPELRDALAVARAAWPGEASASRLIYRLVSAGAEQVRRNGATGLDQRMALAASLAGQYPSTLPVGYLDDLRAEWDR